ncbi:hypothetical protein [Brevundimonas sp.]|uniref:hypothetical protein n=1 Tax=Brevundimonas sp. TaxID=1871086 RepID=UPI001A2C0E5D|nr:hypothetical protein [Brevundimonas sp.]MBJ7485913.1 hypothetical protein [Brevundimonas sp.]
MDRSEDELGETSRGRGGGRPAAPEAVWARVRKDYVAGLSAADCRRRHGVGLTALYERARAEGWRRADRPWAPAVDLDPDDEGAALDMAIDGDLDQVDHPLMIEVADQQMKRAVLRGDANAALRWRRIRLALVADLAEIDRNFEALEREMQPVRARLRQSPQTVETVETVETVDDVTRALDRLMAASR